MNIVKEKNNKSIHRLDRSILLLIKKIEYLMETILNSVRFLQDKNADVQSIIKKEREIHYKINDFIEFIKNLGNKNTLNTEISRHPSMLNIISHQLQALNGMIDLSNFNIIQTKEKLSHEINKNNYILQKNKEVGFHLNQIFLNFNNKLDDLLNSKNFFENSSNKKINEIKLNRDNYCISQEKNINASKINFSKSHQTQNHLNTLSQKENVYTSTRNQFDNHNKLKSILKNSLIKNRNSVDFNRRLYENDLFQDQIFFDRGHHFKSNDSSFTNLHSRKSSGISSPKKIRKSVSFENAYNHKIK